MVTGLLQKDYPEVALGVKTRQAIRAVLNNLREEVHVLLQDGMLEEAEGTEVAGVIYKNKTITPPPQKQTNNNNKKPNKTNRMHRGNGEIALQERKKNPEQTSQCPPP